MKNFMVLVALLFCMLAVVGCSNPDTENKKVNEATVTEHQSSNAVLNFLTLKYGLTFRLWGPEGSDLYAFYIYPDFAEREYQILMPSNSDDASIYHKDLSWRVEDDELFITGDWQETFKIDLSAETATSAETGKVYQICEMSSPLE